MKDAEKMGALAGEIGIPPAAPPGEERRPGRPIGAKGEFESPKNWDKKRLEKEIWKHRKEIKALREKVESATPPDQGVGSMGDLPSNLPPEIWGILPSIAYDYLADRFGDYWRLSAQEVKYYGIVTEKLVNRYAGAYLQENPELGAFIVVVTMTTLPRSLKLLKDRGKHVGGKSGSDGTRSEGNGKDDMGKGSAAKSH